MSKAAEYNERKEARRAERARQAQRREKHMPFVSLLCKKYGITLSSIPGGHQFRVNEYILNWWPGTNRIIVQYAGSNDTKEFRVDTDGEPKIVAAIRKLARVTGRV